MISRGFSLTEMLVVVAIIGIVAVATTTSLSSSDAVTLDAATSEVVGLIRFAQSEAIRTGVAHGVNADFSTKRIRVYSLPASTPIYDVYDPLIKQLYAVDYSAGASAVSLLSVFFKFENYAPTTSYLGFSGGSGLPKYNDSGSIRMLDTAYVQLGYEGEQRTINVSPMTGRVSVQ